MAHSPDMAKFDTLKAQTRTCQSVKLSKPDAVLTAMEPEQQRLTRSASVPTGAGRGQGGAGSTKSIHEVSICDAVSMCVKVQRFGEAVRKPFVSCSCSCSFLFLF